MKKILSLVLAMLMIFSMVPAVFAAETSESDYQAAIEYLSAIDLWKGYGDGEDGADDQVLRYQMALFTARMVTGRTDAAYWETDANDSDFTDIDALNAEALGGVCYAAQQGIVNGIGGNEFAPLDNVTYRDAIVMIVRALGFNYPASGYPWSYINKARELGVLDGITGVSYTAEVKREVVAQLLYNAINAEIKGESIAANVFGVEETIVMVTASYDLVYGADASKSLKETMVKVSAIDAEGEPIGAEYYVSYRTLGAKNPTQANALVGTYFKVTHKGNFAEFLAVESLTKVFENTPSKKEVTYVWNTGVMTLDGEQYTAISGDYSDVLNNTQITANGVKELKVFKAFGAAGVKSTGTAAYILAADGNIYAKSNPFVPYAVYSALVDGWFKVTVGDVTTNYPAVNDDPTTAEDESANAYYVTIPGNMTYTPMDDEEVDRLLAQAVGQAQGFVRLKANTSADYNYYASRLDYRFGVEYDYYKAIASDIDGDGDYDRVTARPYELLRISKENITRKINDSNSTVTVFKATSFVQPVNDALYGYYLGQKTTSDYMTTTKYDLIDWEDTKDGNGVYTDVYLYRSTGISIDKVPNGAFVVAYVTPAANAFGKDREIEIIEVIGGAQEDAEDNAYVFQTYIRGYDSVTNKVVYGANYDTMYFGTYAVKNSSAFDAPHAYSSNRSKYVATTAQYVQQFWNKYVNVYVLNGAVIYIEEVGNANDFVILDAFTDFTEDGLKAMAYSTKDGGYAEVTIGELNGWSLGGYDYELFMLLKQMTDLGLTVKDYPLPIALNKIYSVRSVDENGAYNLVEAVPMNDGNPASVYVNNYGYILGVKDNGTLNAESRVPTSDKDLWIIQTQKCVAEERDATTGKMVPHNSADCKGLTGKCEVVKSNVVMFKGKLSAIELVGFKWYKVADNQYVAIAPVGYELGPILGNTSEGLDYWMYNQYINNYKNETLFNGFYYGHYMTNVRTGAVEFVTYDSKLASDLFANNPNLTYNYIVLKEGAIYPAVNKVLKTDVPTTMKAVADFQYASAKYHAYVTAAVGAVLPVGYEKNADGSFKLDANGQKIKSVNAEVDFAVLNVNVPGATAAHVSYNDLRDAIALNLYAGVYNKDFTNVNTSTDVYAQIRKELLANVTFIHRTAAGKYESWIGYKSSDNTFPNDGKVLGSATSVAVAYVMYDYANASAKVFIDSMPTIDLTKSVSSEIVINGVDGTLTYAYNGLQNLTTISVALDEVTQFDLTYGGETKSIIAKAYSFNVVGEVATGATVVGAAVDASTLTTPVTIASINEYGAVTAQGGSLGLVIDGDYAQSATLNEYRYNTKHDKATRLTEAFEEITSSEAGYSDARHLAAWVLKLNGETDLDALRVVVPDNGVDFLFRNFTIRTKNSAGVWNTAVVTSGKIVPGSSVSATDAAGWVKVTTAEDADAKANYWYYDIALTNNNEDIVEVAFMYSVVDASGAIVTPCASSSWHFINIAEIELY